MNSEQLCISLLQRCKTLKQIQQLQALVSKSGLEPHPFIAGELILTCAISVPGSLVHARRILLHTPNPDVFMYNTLSRGLSESESPENSLVTFSEMRRRSLVPDSFSFAFSLKVAADLMSLEAGIQLHCQALVHGFNTHLFVGTTLTSLYGECGCLEHARKVFDEIPHPNAVAWNAMLTACVRCEDVGSMEVVFDKMTLWDLTSWNVMISGYMKAGDLRMAGKLFSEMPLRDDVSWSTMIVGFAQSGCFEGALECFRELRQTGMKVNEVSLTGVLSACAQAGALEFGKIIHGFIEKAGYGCTVSVCNAILDTYARCGYVDVARSVFQSMGDRRSIVTWTSMIVALAMHGYGEEVIQLFRELEDSGVVPDAVIFVSVLYACSHAGLVDEGCRYFAKMTEGYGIEAGIEHYGCMVDLYARAGLLRKAFEFINDMPISPGAVIWRTLLGACSIHGDVELAEEVKQRVSELEPDDAGDHVLLSKVYASAGKWKDVAGVRKLMSARSMVKTPGWSMIEVDKIMYTFVAGGEEFNEITSQAYEKLKEIMFRLKVEGGYVPTTTKIALHDLEEEEKEDAVSRHSEKLAVAFGMLRTRKGGIIRVVKNLRICSDCHNVMNMISRIYGVVILVRDRSRFHCFKDGTCTCRGYW